MFLYERDRIISSKPCEEYTSKNKDVPFDVIILKDTIKATKKLQALVQERIKRQTPKK